MPKARTLKRDGKHCAVMDRFLKTREVRIRDELVEIYLPLARHTMEAFLARIQAPRFVDRDAVWSAAMEGLTRAIENFDPVMGSSFKSYAMTRIRGAMLDALRRQDLAGRPGRARRKRADWAEAGLAHRLGHRPSPEELGQLEEMDGLTALPQKVSLDFPDWSEDERLSNALEIALTRPSTAGLADRIGRAFFEEVVKDLSTEHRIVLWARYRVGRKFHEIGEFLGLSEAWASIAHRDALAKLRRRLDSGETWELWASQACW